MPRNNERDPAKRPSGKSKVTRLPVAPESLRPSYANRKETSRKAATAILQAIFDAGMPFNKQSWIKKKNELNEQCDWRTTYARHLADLFEGHRRPTADVPLSRELKKKDVEISKLLAAVRERNTTIAKLEERINQLEWDNNRMSRGTRERRRRKLAQGRHSESADKGSEAIAT
ncbi:hypothetical protein SAQ01S_26050 [Sphingomonas aquatilis NBRC 16722]|uniref:Septal ring factor EnvC (AmiA/AmiB activator) n=1 Tax=Sphingomonas aquatilis TaxID=93063 RepID=A0AAW3TWX9_9SPHN|nr:hypothetical protein [Sphingomonas aquatilis]MBB3877001.1 septal ring factor EnvC (AmiA/AmiB activator) [Sphingomonas aquatilis]GEM72839.1 hypothetical protein SAQ01S_26050 [Sphingomonas aquatilis NBRC 16722]